LGSADDRQALTKSVHESCVALMAEIEDVRGLVLCEETFSAHGANQ
jgi:hypothetical protein